MTDKTTTALKLAENTLEDIIRVYKFETGTPVTALAAIREARAEHEKQEHSEQYWLHEINNARATGYEKGRASCKHDERMLELGVPVQPMKQEPKYSELAGTHNWTPHNYTDEQWQQLDQEYQDHLVNQSFDWAEMAAKHQLMEGYRIGLAEMREKCAKVCEEMYDLHEEDWDYCVGLVDCAAAIRAINFEGDTGFRLVSEMVAAHKQDPKKAAAIEKAKMRKAEKEPLLWGDDKFAPHERFVKQEQAEPCKECGAKQAQIDRLMLEYCPDEMTPEQMQEWEKNIKPFVEPVQEPVAIVTTRFSDNYLAWDKAIPPAGTKLYAAPVSAKREWVDLSNDEIDELIRKWHSPDMGLLDFAWAVIAAVKEKNK